MKPTVTHIVNIFLDYDRPDVILKPEWIVKRFDQFQATTLRSLLGQTYQDFRIWVYCGLRNKALTQSFDWHPRIERIYGEGRDAMKTVDTDFVAVTRIDSDDLMHREAMADVHNAMVYDATKRCVLIFKRNLAWNQNYNFIEYHYRKAPPFFTHIFPRSIYQDFTAYYRGHFVKHGQSGARRSDAIELPVHRICVIKHQENISDIRRNREPAALTPEGLARLRAKGCIYAEDEKIIGNILTEFGQ